ncbi:hypothetical protein [Nocardia sp. CS682]|uniref:hypothetical protein n=1 Tax=Nocardia sp. CS682 TaxID=1047172 RepID=UPI00107519F5|nr:hypothetical protein [Nocardia sp. CS682]QBS45291.1 hypothetical protein DMB37_39655 [Nocardia sp. CS682]
MAADYAPDLDLRATIAYAPANHFTEQLLAFGNPATPASLTPGEVTAYAAYGLRALTVARPDFDLDSYLTPIGKQVLADTARLCLDPMAERVGTIGFGQMLTKPLAVGDFPTVAATTFEIPLTGYQRPVFVAQGLADTAVFPVTTDLLAAELTAHANPLTYRHYPDQDHMSILATATEDGLAFAETHLRR